MKITGSNVVPFPVDRVWDAILDPRVLVATIPGCEKLTAVDDNAYDMTVTAGVAAIKGTYAGSCTLSDLAEHQSLVMRLRGAGAPGTIDATVDVVFNDLGTEGTRIDYAADAVVGGMVGGVGQRMLTSVSKRMAGEFFGNVASALVSPAESAQSQPGHSAESAQSQPGPGQVFSAPARTSAISSQDDFVRGILVGAGLVLLGVIAGSVLGRRR